VPVLAEAFPPRVFSSAVSHAHADLSHEIDTAEVRDRALHAFLEWYADIACACEEIIYPHNPHISARQYSKWSAKISDRTQALAWLETECANLMAALHAADRADLRQCVLKIAESVRFLHAAGRPARRGKLRGGGGEKVERQHHGVLLPLLARGYIRRASAYGSGG
jgi:hypothetical protein